MNWFTVIWVAILLLFHGFIIYHVLAETGTWALLDRYPSLSCIPEVVLRVAVTVFYILVLVGFLAVFAAVCKWFPRLEPAPVFLIMCGVGLVVIFRKEPFLHGLGWFLIATITLYLLLTFVKPVKQESYEDMSKEELIQELETRDRAESPDRWDSVTP